MGDVLHDCPVCGQEQWFDIDEYGGHTNEKFYIIIECSECFHSITLIEKED